MPDKLPNAPTAAVVVMSFVIVSLVEPREPGLGAGLPPSEQLIALKSAVKLYGQASAKPSSPATVWRGLTLARSLVWRDYHTNEWKGTWKTGDTGLHQQCDQERQAEMVNVLGVKNNKVFFKKMMPD